MVRAFSAGNDASGRGQFLAAAIRLNILISVIGIGLGTGLTFFIGTHVSLAITGPHGGSYLDLLGVFMPGYATSPSGAWMGLLWGLFYGGLSGGLMAWLYSRTLSGDLSRLAVSRSNDGRGGRLPVLLLSLNSLGLALSSICALQLVLTTWWLIARGTAATSPHAKLLSNYLPGYDTTVFRGFLGGVELFVLVYLLSLVAGGVYNFVVRRRHGGLVQ